MKRITIIGKKQILMVTMVLALGAAVWLNVKYSTDGTSPDPTVSVSDSDLGQAKYVSATNIVENDDYFSKTRAERETSRQEQTELLEKTLKSVKSDELSKQEATKQITAITTRKENETNIETLIKAKGFSDAIAVITEDSCSVIIKKEGEIEQNESVQILDIVHSVSKINLENIKIVTVG